jgi:hypothetical protein
VKVPRHSQKAKRKQYRTEAGAGCDGYQQWWCFATKSFSQAVEQADRVWNEMGFSLPTKERRAE